MAKKSYTAMPRVPPETEERYRAVMAVLSGELTVSAGARRLGVSRNHFQSLMHRALGSFIEELGPKEGGRPKVPGEQRRLERDLARSRLENVRLRRRVETTDRVLAVASGLLRGRLAPRMRREGGTGEKTPAEEE